jgi:hypothetical protein
MVRDWRHGVAARRDATIAIQVVGAHDQAHEQSSAREKP